MTLPSHIELAERVVDTTADRLVRGRDELETVYIVHPHNQKVLVQLQRCESPVTNVRLQRVNSQNTANCLIMQNIDISQPFVSHLQFSRGLSKAEQEEFEDSLMSVHKHHQVMCQNGYSLWSCDVIIGHNSVTVNNVYVPRPSDGTMGYGDLEAIHLRAYVNLHEVKEIMDLHKVNGLWLLTKDADTDLLGTATCYVKMQDEYKPQIHITSQYLGPKPKRPITPCVMSEKVMNAFGVYRIHEHHRTSEPGTTNNINIYQFSDTLENVRELKIVTNID